MQCALAAVKSISDPYFRIKYQRLVRRRGKKKAIIAIARMLLVSIYHIIETGEVFNPSDHDAVVNGTRKRKQQSREAALTKSFTVQELLAVCASYGQNSTQQISAQELLKALTAQTVQEPANAG